MNVLPYTLYEKRGRRYYPVHEYDPKVMDSYPKGFHLVHVQPGSTSIRYHVEPDVPTLLAAAKLLEDAMAEAMRDRSKWESTKALTEPQLKAYKAFEKAMGCNIYNLQSASAHDIIQAGIKVLMDSLKESSDGCTSLT